MPATVCTSLVLRVGGTHDASGTAVPATESTTHARHDRLALTTSIGGPGLKKPRRAQAALRHQFRAGQAVGQGPVHVNAFLEHGLAVEDRARERWDLGLGADHLGRDGQRTDQGSRHD
jgi:hypothetical protein